jgi:hypothetical protein
LKKDVVGFERCIGEQISAPITFGLLKGEERIACAIRRALASPGKSVAGIEQTGYTAFRRTAAQLKEG